MSTIGTTAGVNGSDFSVTPNAYDSLSSEDFLKIILQELTKQDPLKPNDTTALVEQISTIRSIESDLKLTDRLESIASQGQLSSAGALIGKRVTGLDVFNNEITSIVKSVSVTADGPVLNLQNGSSITFDNIQEITENVTETEEPEETEETDETDETQDTEETQDP